MPQPLILTWATKPSDWIQRHKKCLVGKSVRNSTEFRNQSNSRPFELQNFHQNFIFPIVKCVPANSEHIFFRFGILSLHLFFQFHESENVPNISFFWPTMKISSRISWQVYLKIHNHVDVGVCVLVLRL